MHGIEEFAEEIGAAGDPILTQVFGLRHKGFQVFQAAQGVLGARLPGKPGDGDDGVMAQFRLIGLEQQARLDQIKHSLHKPSR